MNLRHVINEISKVFKPQRQFLYQRLSPHLKCFKFHPCQEFLVLRLSSLSNLTESALFDPPEIMNEYANNHIVDYQASKGFC